MYKLLPFLALLFMGTISRAQTNVSGTVKDTTAHVPVKNAVVALLSPTDSILKGFVRTKEDGSFILKNMAEGKYILMVMHPQFADYVDDINVTAGMPPLAAIPVTPKSKLLEAVIIKSGSPIRIKGDTTIYTADSFKVSANANVEELLKKMPGFQVDKNGQIKSMGEVVEKVLVDGEEFFGDDPGMAVKNLRADAVKEVQVFNKKSDQAEFTGIDDGKTQKTINLKLKENKKTGYFGKIALSGGPLKEREDRCNNNLMLSSFKGKRKITGFVLQGNTGQDGLSWQDSEKFGGDDNMSMSMDDDGGIMYMWKGGTSDEEPYVNTENGFIKNLNAGVQYSNKWNDKQTFNFSPKYNSQIYNNYKQIFAERYLGGDTVLQDRSRSDAYVNRYNIKTNASYDVKLDSNNSLKLTARANFYNTKSEEQTFTERSYRDKELLNSTDKTVRTNTEKQSFSGSAIFKHKFSKARRTLSLNADWNLLNTDGNNYLSSHNIDHQSTTPGILDVDQLRDSEKSTQRTSARGVYTEPLGKKYSLELSHEYSFSYGQNNQVTYTYTPATGKYDTMVDSLSNEFVQKVTINKPGLKINFSDKKIKYNFGSGFGLTHYDLLDKTFNKDYIRNFTNFFPAASFTYTYKSNHNLRFNYNGNTTQPTLNQLQPLRNNTDQYNQYIGNADLKPSFSNQFNLQHNGYNFIKDMWTYQSLNVRTTSNSITNSVIYDGGKTTTQPINTNGNLNVSLWSGIGFKLKKIDTRFNFNPNLSYSKFADVINGNTTFSKTLNAGMNIWISKTRDKKYDLNLGNDFSYSRNRNSRSASANHFSTYGATLDATVYMKKVWSIATDYHYYFRQAVTAGSGDLNNHLWNAKLQRTFKNNEFTAYVKVFDILDQNVGIDRNFYGNSYTETRNDRLRRYFMLGFSWDFKNKGAVATK